MTVVHCAHCTVFRILFVASGSDKTTVLGSDSEQKDQDPDTTLPYYGLNLLLLLFIIREFISGQNNYSDKEHNPDLYYSLNLKNVIAKLAVIILEGNVYMYCTQHDHCKINNFNKK